ncbi:MAG: ribonuclease T2 [Paracoccaceae bacterium]
MRHWLAAFLALCLGFAAHADGERAGDFDYYVMSLGWSSNWCVLEGDARGDDQCDARHNFTFTLHGLWPQHEAGWPSYCRTAERDPSRGESEAMADIMGGAGLAWYQWKKHGRCAGLSAKAYYAAMRRAYGTVIIPPIFAKVSKDLKVPASVIQDAFLQSNPGLQPDMITVTCDRGMIQEARICLTTDLKFRKCAGDVVRDCTLKNAILGAVR